jgi:plasmid stabilization system protein ParE
MRWMLLLVVVVGCAHQDPELVRLERHLRALEDENVARATAYREQLERTGAPAAEVETARVREADIKERVARRRLDDRSREVAAENEHRAAVGAAIQAAGQSIQNGLQAPPTYNCQTIGTQTTCRPY